ncbi:MAG: SH3 domain-containing protein [Anaerolineae bacterium]|nr:SH3 domain-containing protein [Anaerolineae bacterium]
MKNRASLLVALVLIGLAVTAGRALEFGVGWTGVFYSNTSFSGSAAATITNISGLNFNWPGVPTVNGATVSNVGENNFSARFTSSQSFSQARYQFTVSYDDNVRVLIDGSNVFDDFSGGPVKTRTFDRDMTAGTHSLTVEFVEISAEAVLQFQWFLSGAVPTVGPSPTPGQTNTPAPTSPPPVPAGALTATVIRATVLNARSGPFLGADRVDRLLRGQTYVVVGRDKDARWFLLQLSNKQAWALGYYLAVNGNEFNAPVVSAFVTQGNPAAQTGVVAQTRAGMKLRAAPSVASEQIGRVTWGAILPILGRTRSGEWYQVVWKGTPGWVYSSFLEIIEGNVNTVPVIQ